MKRIVSRLECLPVRFRNSRTFPALTLILVSALLTSACGFKLRSAVEIPPELNPMFVQPQSGSPVRNAILEQLQGSQVQLAARPQDANVIIRIKNESRGSRVAAVDRNGKALTYELHYRVAFDAVAPGGKQLVPLQSLDLVRGHDNPNVEVLGKQLEADLIYEDMIRDAANRILGRLRAVLL
jgi:LPS-assembly lipoprotein